MKNTILIASAWALLAAGAPASAAEVEWLFQGQLTTVEGPDANGFNVGDSFSFVMHFDSAAPVTNPLACGSGDVGTVCRHNDDASMYFSDIHVGAFGPGSFGNPADGGVRAESIILRNNTPDPTYGDTIDGYTFGVQKLYAGGANDAFNVIMRGPQDLGLVTDGRVLPTTPPPGLVGLRDSLFQVCSSTTDQFDCSNMDLKGTFTAISAVPEPETYALMIAGLGVLGWAGRRRRS